MVRKADVTKYKGLSEIVETVRKSYPDKHVSSMWLDGKDVGDPLFTFIVNEVKSIYDPSASFTDNKAEAVRVASIAVSDLEAVVKGLKAIKI